MAWSNGHVCCTEASKAGKYINSVQRAINENTVVELANSVNLGPVYFKLTKLSVNVPLKFQMLVSQICQYFLLKNIEKLLHCIFSTKNFSVLGYKFVKPLTS